MAVAPLNLPAAEPGGGLIKEALGNFPAFVVRLRATMPSSLFVALRATCWCGQLSSGSPSTDKVTQRGKPFA